MSADLDTVAELRRHYYGGKQALRVMERCTPVPREPRERTELFNAMRLLNNLVEGYAPSEDASQN